MSGRGPRRAGIGVVLFALAVLPAGCGGADTGIVLTVDSSRAVPDEIDRLLVRIAAEGSAPKDVIRHLDRPFPHTLGILLETGAAPVTVILWGVKGEAEVSQVQVEVQPVVGEVVDVRVVL